jgi:hypothetical protein
MIDLEKYIHDKNVNVYFDSLITYNNVQTRKNISLAEITEGSEQFLSEQFRSEQFRSKQFRSKQFELLEELFLSIKEINYKYHNIDSNLLDFQII